MMNILIFILAMIGFIDVCEWLIEWGWKAGRKINEYNKDDELIGGGFCVEPFIHDFDNTISDVPINEDESESKPKRKYTKKKKAIVAETASTENINNKEKPKKKESTKKKKQEE